MIRLSYLVADYPEIKELDINPLLVSGMNSVALDARVVLDRELIGRPVQPYPTWPSVPTPRNTCVEPGSSPGPKSRCRPIKPEDEPLWMELLAGCSPETIYSRFRYFFFWQSHEVATRYCYIDYDREMAIVVEIVEGDKKRLLGVGRLVADPMRESGEYAILIKDGWQDQGLGGILTDYCIEIARDWGIKKITARDDVGQPPDAGRLPQTEFRNPARPESSIVEVSRSKSRNQGRPESHQATGPVPVHPRRPNGISR